MNDSNIKKQQLPLKLSLNLNRNKDVIDDTFSYASRLENAPVYNNTITPYYRQEINNGSETIYDRNNKEYVINSSGNVVSGSATLFTVNLKQFKREELTEAEDCLNYDRSQFRWSPDTPLQEVTSYITSDNYNIIINYKPLTSDSNKQHIININKKDYITSRIRTLKGNTVYAVLYNRTVNGKQRISAYLGIINLLHDVITEETIDLYWKWRGNQCYSEDIVLSGANLDSKALENELNSSLEEYEPLIQISNPVGNVIAFSFLYKKGVIDQEQFAFSTVYTSLTQPNWKYNTVDSPNTIIYQFNGQQQVEINVNLHIQLALLVEAPFHYLDTNDFWGYLYDYEIVPAGTYVKAYARLTEGINYPISIKVNYSWPSRSLSATDRGNLPKKYGRRKYDNGSYTVIGGDGNTNWSNRNGLNYNEIDELKSIPSISIDSNNTNWNNNQTQRLEEDTQVACYRNSSWDNLSEQRSPSVTSSGTTKTPVTRVFGRSLTKPTITSIEITLNNNKQVVEVNSSDYSYVYYDPYTGCDKNNRLKHKWFSDDAEYTIGSGWDIYRNNNYRQQWARTSWQSWLNYSFASDGSTPMPKSHIDNYSDDMETTLSEIISGNTRTYFNQWCYSYVLDQSNDIQHIYQTIWIVDQDSNTLTSLSPAQTSNNASYKVDASLTFKDTEASGDSFRSPAEYIMDDGVLYNSDYRKFNYNLHQGTAPDDYSVAYILSATINSMTTASFDNNDPLTIYYNVIQSVNPDTALFDKYHKSNTRIVDQGLFANTIAYSYPSTSYGGDMDGQDWSETDKWYFIYYDNTINNKIANPGVVQSSFIYKNSAAYYYLPMYYHIRGYSTQINNWNLLYNNGVLSGISYSDNSNERGTLVTPWYSIDSNYYISATNDKFIYKDTNGKVWRISIVDGNDIKILFDRYILINTTSYYNCYDMLKNKVIHFADDWNNRITLGRTASNSSFIEENNNSTLLYTSSIGEQYTVEDNYLPSLMPNPIAYVYSAGNTRLFTNNIIGDPVNLYTSNSSNTYAVYNKSIVDVIDNVNGIVDFTFNNNLIGLTYPVSSNGMAYLNPCIFHKQLRSYTNSDMFYLDDIGYAVTYYNNSPIVIYNLTTEIDNVSALFVIQAQRYGVINNKIMALSYNNNTITGTESLLDVSGLKFIGFLPNAGYFYSKKNRSIYQYTGDANLSLLTECTEIDDIYNTYYDTSTKTLYWLTNKGFYAYTGDYCWFIKAEDVETFYCTDSDIIIKFNDYSNVLLRHEPAQGYTKLPYIIQTAYYGSTNNQISKLGEIRILTIDEAKETGDYIKLNAYTQTDKDTVSQSQKYDRQKIIPFTPKYDQGTGSSFEIEGNIPIRNIVINYLQINSSQKSNNSGVIR